jgi:hypothetical protein
VSLFGHREIRVSSFGSVASTTPCPSKKITVNGMSRLLVLHDELSECRLVTHIHQQGIGCVVMPERMRDTLCHIMKLSVNRESTTFRIVCQIFNQRLGC